MCLVGKGSAEVLLAGCQNFMFRVGIENGEILETVGPPMHLAWSNIDDFDSWPRRITTHC